MTGRTPFPGARGRIGMAGRLESAAADDPRGEGPSDACRWAGYKMRRRRRMSRVSLRHRAVPMCALTRAKSLSSLRVCQNLLRLRAAARSRRTAWLAMKTFSATPNDISQKWFVVDAEGNGPRPPRVGDRAASSAASTSRCSRRTWTPATTSSSSTRRRSA